MEARESVLSTPLLGDVKKIGPIIQPGMSDSASLDNVLEFFVMSGLSLPHAMAMLVPESFNDKNPISEELKAFYEYHSILMEPWDGPAALLFSDGRYAGGMLDRNGLRPARYLITKNDMMVVASEAGVINFEPEAIKEKGRLQPGKILLVDTQEGRIYYDGELKSHWRLPSLIVSGFLPTVLSWIHYAVAVRFPILYLIMNVACVHSDLLAKT